MFGVTLVQGRLCAGEGMDRRHRPDLQQRHADRFQRRALSAQGAVEPPGVLAAAASGDDERRLRPARPRLRGAELRSPVHELHRSRGRQGPHRRHQGTRREVRSRYRRLHHRPRGVPSDAEPRPRTITTITRVRISTRRPSTITCSRRRTSATATRTRRSSNYKQRFSAGTGSYPLVGTPDHGGGANWRNSPAPASTGAALSFVNCKNELPYFCETVMPRLKEAGLRGVMSALVGVMRR